MGKISAFGRCIRLGTVLTVLLIFGFSFAGCLGSTREIEGHWVDVNGNNTLDISGSHLTLRSGKWEETYRFKRKMSDGIGYIVPEKEDSFGGMSELKIGEDGILTAYEMVLDAEGHQYRFVREENLAKELEIQDLSKDMPKEIKSNEIESFSLSFANWRGSYDLGDRWPSGRYSWTIKRKDGQYDMHFRVMGDSYIAFDFQDTVSDEYVAGLAQLLKEQGIIRQNGYHKKNNVHRPGYSLYVTYASNERLSIRAEGTASDTCVFQLEPLLNYAEKQKLIREE